MDKSRDAVFRNLASLLTGVIGTGREADVAISPQLDAVVVIAEGELVLSCNLSEFVASGASTSERS